MLFTEVSKFPSSLDPGLKTNFQTKVDRKLVFVEKYKRTYRIILDNETCEG